MTARRGRGEGGLYWDENRQRFIAAVVIGYTPAGKRIVRRGSGKTKTEARAKLKEVLSQRVTDGVLLRLISKWLHAGVLERGELHYPGAGTPQGGVISPLLANIYLH